MATPMKSPLKRCLWSLGLILGSTLGLILSAPAYSCADSLKKRPPVFADQAAERAFLKKTKLPADFFYRSFLEQLALGKEYSDPTHRASLKLEDILRLGNYYIDALEDYWASSPLAQEVDLEIVTQDEVLLYHDGFYPVFNHAASSVSTQNRIVRFTLKKGVAHPTTVLGKFLLQLQKQHATLSLIFDPQDTLFALAMGGFNRVANPQYWSIMISPTLLAQILSPHIKKVEDIMLISTIPHELFHVAQLELLQHQQTNLLMGMWLSENAQNLQFNRISLANILGSDPLIYETCIRPEEIMAHSISIREELKVLQAAMKNNASPAELNEQLSLIMGRYLMLRDYIVGSVRITHAAWEKMVAFRNSHPQQVAQLSPRQSPPADFPYTPACLPERLGQYDFIMIRLTPNGFAYQYLLPKEILGKNITFNDMISPASYRTIEKFLQEQEEYFQQFYARIANIVPQIMQLEQDHSPHSQYITEAIAGFTALTKGPLDIFTPAR